jgi:hypothetical protein
MFETIWMFPDESNPAAKGREVAAVPSLVV